MFIDLEPAALLHLLLGPAVEDLPLQQLLVHGDVPVKHEGLGHVGALQSTGAGPGLRVVFCWGQGSLTSGLEGFLNSSPLNHGKLVRYMPTQYVYLEGLIDTDKIRFRMKYKTN